MDDLTCTKCQTTKPATDFTLDKRRKTGRASWCRGCKAAYYQANKGIWQRQDRTAYKREYHQRTRLSARAKRLLREYGITIEQYQAMVDEQEGRCAICRREKPLFVDHCHVKGDIRGLLCDLCNRGLGFFGDNPVWLRAAAAYLD